MKRLSKRGFTLVEMLVVLTLAALLVGMLMQALTLALGLQRRLSSQSLVVQSNALQHEWFRQLIQELQPVAPREPGRFAGTDAQFESFGFAPLGLGESAALPLKLRLKRGDSGLWVLELVRLEERWLLMEWPDARDVKFEYQLADGRFTDRWPLPGAPSRALPGAIWLRVTEASGQARTLVAVPRNTEEPLAQGTPVFLP